MQEISLSQMRDLLRQDQMTAKPWIGDRPEQECALFMQSVVDTKLAKLTRLGYDLLEKIGWQSTTNFDYQVLS
jgi:hypothetical protein